MLLAASMRRPAMAATSTKSQAANRFQMNTSHKARTDDCSSNPFHEARRLSILIWGCKDSGTGIVARTLPSFLASEGWREAQGGGSNVLFEFERRPRLCRQWLLAIFTYRHSNHLLARRGNGSHLPRSFGKTIHGGLVSLVCFVRP